MCLFRRKPLLHCIISCCLLQSTDYTVSCDKKRKLQRLPIIRRVNPYTVALLLSEPICSLDEKYLFHSLHFLQLVTGDVQCYFNVYPYL